MNKILVAGAGILGLILLIIAVVYFITPANTLPSFMPGFDLTLTKIHFKHGVGAAILGLGCFVFAWFKSGKKSTT